MLFFGKNPRLREVIGNIRVAKVSCFLLSCIKTYFHNKRFLINSCLRFESESCWKSDMVYYLTLPLKPGSHDLRWYVMARLCAKIALLIESRTSRGWFDVSRLLLVLSFLLSSTPILISGGGYATKFWTGRLHHEGQPLTFLYTIVAEN